MSDTIDQQFIEYIVRTIVENPDDVQITRTVDEMGVLLELQVNQEDLGRVIGKKGSTAQSMRTLLRALGTKNDARYNLKIVDPEADQKPPREERPAPVANDQPAADGVADEPADDEVSVEDAPAEEVAEEPAAEESLADKTRRELDDLDDLDI